MAKQEFNEVAVQIPALNNKTVLVKYFGTEPYTGALKAEFERETQFFIEGLVARNQIRDPELGLNPRRPTHEVRKGSDGAYRLQRLGFN